MDGTTYPKAIDTLGALLDDRYQLETYCDRCRVGQGPADLAALAGQLGRGFRFVHPTVRVLSPHLPCPDCLAPMDYRLHPAGQPDAGGAHGRAKTEKARPAP